MLSGEDVGKRKLGSHHQGRTQGSWLGLSITFTYPAYLCPTPFTGEHDHMIWEHDPMTQGALLDSLGSIITWFVEHYHLVLLLCLWSIITWSREKGLGTKLHTWAVLHSQYSLRKFGQSCFTTHHIWVNLQLYLLPFPFPISHFPLPILLVESPHLIWVLLIV